MHPSHKETIPQRQKCVVLLFARSLFLFYRLIHLLDWTSAPQPVVTSTNKVHLHYVSHNESRTDLTFTPQSGK